MSLTATGQRIILSDVHLSYGSQPVLRGLADIAAGRTHAADAAIAKLQQRRTASAKTKASRPAAKKRG